MLEGLSSLAYYRYFSTAMLIPYLGGGVLKVLADIASRVLSHAVSA